MCELHARIELDPWLTCSRPLPAWCRPCQDSHSRPLRTHAGLHRSHAELTVNNREVTARLGVCGIFVGDWLGNVACQAVVFKGFRLIAAAFVQSVSYLRVSDNEAAA